MSSDLTAQRSGGDAEAPRQIRVVGTIHIPQQGHDAFVLFTPLGERAWAHDWDPRFPAPVADDSEPGTVFEIAHGHARSTWIVCRREPEQSIQYARVIPGKNAGTVTVTLAPDDQGVIVTVEYRLTALSDEEAVGLSHFASHYPAFLQEWETAIAAIHAKAGGADV